MDFFDNWNFFLIEFEIKLGAKCVQNIELVMADVDVKKDSHIEQYHKIKQEYFDKLDEKAKIIFK